MHLHEIVVNDLYVIHDSLDGLSREQRWLTEDFGMAVVAITSANSRSAAARVVHLPSEDCDFEIGQEITGLPGRAILMPYGDFALMRAQQNKLKAPLMTRWDRFHELFIETAHLLEGASVSAHWRWNWKGTESVKLEANLLIDPIASPAPGLLAHAVGQLTGRPELRPVDAVAAHQLAVSYPPAHDSTESKTAFIVDEDQIEALHDALVDAHASWEIGEVPFPLSMASLVTARKLMASVRLMHNKTANRVIDRLAEAAENGTIAQDLESLRVGLHISEEYLRECVAGLHQRGLVATADDAHGVQHVRLTQASLAGLSLGSATEVS